MKIQKKYNFFSLNVYEMDFHIWRGLVSGWVNFQYVTMSIFDGHFKSKITTRLVQKRYCFYPYKYFTTKENRLYSQTKLFAYKHFFFPRKFFFIKRHLQIFFSIQILESTRLNTFSVKVLATHIYQLIFNFFFLSIQICDSLSQKQ